MGANFSQKRLGKELKNNFYEGLKKAMIIEDEFQISAPFQQVWDFLTDIQAMVSCIPSCQKVEVFEDKSFVLTISQKVGPISATFETQTHFSEMLPPKRLVALGKGQDRLMGSSFEFTNTVELVPLAEKETRVKYKTDVKITGRLASIGQPLIKLVVKKEVAKVFQLMQDRLREPGNENV
jgi:carbon monoxide dehydrogenase subunit G